MLRSAAPLAVLFLRCSRAWARSPDYGLPLGLDWTQVEAIARMTAHAFDTADFDLLLAMEAKALPLLQEDYKRRNPLPKPPAGGKSRKGR